MFGSFEGGSTAGSVLRLRGTRIQAGAVHNSHDPSRRVPLSVGRLQEQRSGTLQSGYIWQMPRDVHNPVFVDAGSRVKYTYQIGELVTFRKSEHGRSTNLGVSWFIR